LEPSLLLFFVIVVAIPVVGALSMNAFQRWLQHKERMGALIADQTAEKAAQYASHVERLEARLRVVEQIVTDGGAQTAAQIEALRPTQRVGPDKVVGTQTTA
jgi:superfamily II DNA/RNA helicase